METTRLQRPSKLSDLVIAEVDLCELLNVNRATLDELRREKGFPYVRLSMRDRVHLGSSSLQKISSTRSGTSIHSCSSVLGSFVGLCSVSSTIRKTAYNEKIEP